MNTGIHTLLESRRGGGFTERQGVSAFALPGIQGGHTAWGEVAQVPGHHGEAMLQGRSGDQQVGTVVAEGGRELSPAAAGGGAGSERR